MAQFEYRGEKFYSDRHPKTGNIIYYGYPDLLKDYNSLEDIMRAIRKRVNPVLIGGE